MKLRNILQKHRDIELPHLLAILGHILDTNQEQILTHPETKITKPQYKKILNLLERYKAQEPLAYLLGHNFFYNHKFLVNKHTLIPRPETEILVDLSLQEIGRIPREVINILEIGTGSGNIAISILDSISKNPQKYPRVNLIATDISPKALSLAKQNAKRLLGNINKRKNIHLTFKLADIILQKLGTKFDLILSNPPYIPTHEYEQLDPSVKKYEPRIALDAGKTAIQIYKRLLEKTASHTNEECTYILEGHENHIQAIAQDLAHNFPEKKIEIIKDLNQRDRFMKLLPNPNL